MILMPKIKNVVENDAYKLVKKYCTSPFWEEEYDDMFTSDIVVDHPHGVPGFWQHYSTYEFYYFRIWLRQIISNREDKAEPVIIQTTDPNTVWAVYFVKCDMFLAKKDCKYENEHAVRFTIRDGKIAGIKDYFNPISFYNALGIILPSFIYDPIDDYPTTRFPADGVSKFTVEQNAQRAINNFANPINVDGDPESIYTDDVLEVCPNAPYSMTEGYTGKDFDVQCEWMFRACPEWNTTPNIPFYQGTDPDVIIVESEGYGSTTWSKRLGHYCQRELQIAFLRDGKVCHFRVYFNPLCKFNSMNQQIPTIPFMNW